MTNLSALLRILDFVGLSNLLNCATRSLAGRHFADVSLPALYNEVAAHIHMLLGKNVTDISFTTDIWSSDISPVSVLSLTAQWIEENFEMKRVMLHGQECPGSHTSAAIARALESMFIRWNITKDMVHAVP